MGHTDTNQDILFIPSGEIITITLYNLGVLLGADKSDHVRTDEKMDIKFDNEYGFWSIPDNKRGQFKRIMNWSGMN